MENLEKITRAKLYAQKGWFYNAALDLAELLYLNEGKYNPSEFRIIMSEFEWQLVRKEALSQLDKGCNILSYGSIWDEDELLLVFSILIDLYLIDELGKVLELSFNLNLSLLKNYLEGINFNLPKNFSAANSVAKMLDKNSLIRNWREISEFDKLF